MLFQLMTTFYLYFALQLTTASRSSNETLISNIAPCAKYVSQMC